MCLEYLMRAGRAQVGSTVLSPVTDGSIIKHTGKCCSLVGVRMPSGERSLASQRENQQINVIHSMRRSWIISIRLMRILHQKAPAAPRQDPIYLGDACWISEQPAVSQQRHVALPRAGP